MKVNVPLVIRAKNIEFQKAKQQMMCMYNNICLDQAGNAKNGNTFRSEQVISEMDAKLLQILFISMYTGMRNISEIQRGSL